MIYTYLQVTGDFLLDDEVLATGYSGFGAGKNNPEMESDKDVGPIPCGIWAIFSIQDSPTLGPLACTLFPTVKTTTYGRSGFYIHGDSIQHPGDASHGCIILPHSVRGLLKVGDEITVVSGIPAPINISLSDDLALEEKLN